MALKLELTATTGAIANGIDKNKVRALLMEGNNLVDNAYIHFSVTGSAIFTDSESNETTAITSVIGDINLSLVNTVGEIVTITAKYVDDPTVSASVQSEFIGDSVILAAPEIEESNDGIIDYSKIEENIHVTIRAYTNMKEGDVITLFITEEMLFETIYIVKESDIGNDISITISDAKKLLASYLNKKLYIFYIINEKKSEVNTYDVVPFVLTIDKVKIVGIRGNNGCAQNLAAFNIETNQPITVIWSYDDYEPVIAERFTDYYPLQNLYITLPKEKGKILLFSGNVGCIGYTKNNQNLSQAFAISGDGKINYWGDNIPWGTPPSSVTNSNDLIGIISSYNIVSVIDSKRTLYSWGSDNIGGEITNIVPNIKTAVCNRTAICAISTKGEIISWGNPSAGGKLPDEYKGVLGFKNIFFTRAAFCALHEEGYIVSWGEKGLGGLMPDDIRNLRNVKSVVGSDGAFALITNDGIVKAWGNSGFGGAMDTSYSGAVALSATARAFSVLLDNKQVRAWGDFYVGGGIPAYILRMNNVISITASDGAFSILCEDGKTYAWGVEQYGSKVPPEINNAYFSITSSSSSGAFSIITNDGYGFSWNIEGLNKSSTEKINAIYKLTRQTSPDYFICIAGNGKASFLGDLGTGSSISSFPEAVKNNMQYSKYIFS